MWKIQMIHSRCWAGLYVYMYAGGYINCQLKMSLPLCDNTNIRLAYVVLGRVTICSCHHTHGKLIFNWQLMHLLTYIYSQHKHLHYQVFNWALLFVKSSSQFLRVCNYMYHGVNQVLKQKIWWVNFYAKKSMKLFYYLCWNPGWNNIVTLTA